MHPLLHAGFDFAKLIKKVILFVILLGALNLIIYIPLHQMANRKNGGQRLSQINYMLNLKGDLYIFGASGARCHYDTRIIENELGLRSFNAGLNGKNAAYQLGLLKMQLKHHTPKVIIYETGDISEYSAKGRFGIEELYPYFYEYSDIRKMVGEKNKLDLLKFAFSLYVHNQQLFTIVGDYFGRHSINPTGYHPLDGYANEDEVQIAKKRQQKRDMLNVDPYLEDCLMEFIQICKKNGIDLYLFKSPWLCRVDFPGTRRIKQIASDERIPFYDFANDPKYFNRMEYFSDATHLNFIGAEEYTKDVVKVLKPRIKHKSHSQN